MVMPEPDTVTHPAPAPYRPTAGARILNGADNTRGQDHELQQMRRTGPARPRRIVAVPPVRPHLREYAGPEGRVGLVTGPKQRTQTPSPAETAAAAAEFLAGQEITTTGCRGCGAEISGLNGRYACACGWVNHWSEGHSPLPASEDDADARA